MGKSRETNEDKGEKIPVNKGDRKTFTNGPFRWPRERAEKLFVVRKRVKEKEKEREERLLEYEGATRFDGGKETHRRTIRAEGRSNARTECFGTHRSTSCQEGEGKNRSNNGNNGNNGRATASNLATRPRGCISKVVTALDIRLPQEVTYPFQAPERCSVASSITDYLLDRLYKVADLITYVGGYVLQ